MNGYVSLLIRKLYARYERDFGFTEEEVKNELLRYNLDSSFDNVREWYDGFRIGNSQGISEGILKKNIYHYGFAFEEKKVLIG